MSWPVLDAYVDAAGIRRGPPTLGQTNGGTHARGSFHYSNRARDYGGRDSDAAAISRLFAPIAKARPDLIPELFGHDGVGFDGGKPFQAPGHTNHHTHVAIGAGVTVEQLAAAAAGAPAPAGGAAAPSEPPAGAAAPSSTGGKGIAESGLRRMFLILGGAGLTVWGLALVGIDLGAAGAVVKRSPVGRLASLAR